jgi:short-subunit dehydrogenase
MTDIHRTLLVSGASTGIGKAITERLLAQGHRIIGLGRHIETAAISNPAFHPHTIDLADLDKLPQQLSQLSRQFPHISGLICCAGQGRFGSLEEFSCRQIRELMDLNFTNHAFLVREMLPAMKMHTRDQGNGHIIFIGSEAALQGGRRGAIYSASKFALRGFSQSLREECARSRIGVSIINPGMVRTGFFDALSFRPGPEDDQAILAEDVATTVDMILGMRPGTVIDEINLSPLKKVIQFETGTKITDNE